LGRISSIDLKAPGVTFPPPQRSVLASVQNIMMFIGLQSVDAVEGIAREEKALAKTLKQYSLVEKKLNSKPFVFKVRVEEVKKQINKFKEIRAQLEDGLSRLRLFVGLENTPSIFADMLSERLDASSGFADLIEQVVDVRPTLESVGFIIEFQSKNP
jgi:hypothetical protein